MSKAVSGELVHADPLLRRKLPEAPDAFIPVPPFDAASVPEIFAADTLKLPFIAPLTFKVPGTRTVSEERPSTTELLLLTVAPDPMAVAKLRFPAPTFAPEPISVFEKPVVFRLPAPWPKNEFSLPVMPVPAPTKMLRSEERRVGKGS